MSICYMDANLLWMPICYMDANLLFWHPLYGCQSVIVKSVQCYTSIDFTIPDSRLRNNFHTFKWYVVHLDRPYNTG